MKKKLVITPQLLEEMESTVKSSASFKAKMTEAKEHIKKNKAFVNAILTSVANAHPSN